MSLTSGIQLGYQLALAALTIMVLLQGSGRMRRTIAIIVAVMAGAYLLKGLWPGKDYAWAMIGVDSLALIGICFPPAGKWQAVVGLSFLPQIATHYGRIIAGDAANLDAYWWGLSITAMIQLLLLYFWWLHGKLSYNGRDRSIAAPASTAGG